MATKQQEREALDKIAEIIKGLGQDSYIAAAFDGCLDMAEDNIGNDFMCSMKARAEDAQQEVASLLVENRKQADSLQALSEAVAQKQKNIDGRDEQIANLNSIIKMQADRIKELEEGVESSASRVMALENENVHLKARLYDILMKWGGVNDALPDCLLQAGLAAHRLGRQRGRARKLAEQLRSTGYSVDVWQHTKDGAQKTDI